MNDIDRYQRENLRLECLKLAAQNEPDFSIKEMQQAAEELYEYLTGSDIQDRPAEPDYPQGLVTTRIFDDADCAVGRNNPELGQIEVAEPKGSKPLSVTMEQIESVIAEERYLNLGQALAVSSVPESGLAQTTLCVLVLKNGYTVIGKSACADPAMYDEQLGRQIAYNDAVRQVWPLLGYELKSLLHFQRQMQEVDEVRD